MKISNDTRFDTRTLRAAICAVHDRLAKTEGRLRQWNRVHVHVVYARTRVRHGCAVLGGTYMKLILQGPQPARVFRGHDGSRITDEDPLRCPHCGGGPEVFHTTGSDGRRLDDGTYEMLHQHYGHKCKVRAPSRVTPRVLAALVDHEIRHLYGFSHDKMPGAGGHSNGRMAALEVNAAAWVDDHPAFSWKNLPERAPRVKVKRDIVSERFEKIVERERSWTTRLKRAQTALRKLKTQRRYYEKRLAAQGRTSGDKT